MKHTIIISLSLVILFLSAHLIGFYIINNYLPKTKELPLKIEKPQFEEKTAYIPIIITIVIATLLALVLLKFRALKLWKAWFFISVFICLTIAFSAFMKEKIAIVAAFILSLLKTFKPNVIIHNLTEVFIYGGLAAVFVPVLNIFSVIILLIVISIYDMIAVWKTKHMVSLAKFQADSNIFAGLFIPYKLGNKKINNNVKVSNVKTETKNAILGGGDIGFTLLFSGVVFKFSGFIPALVVSVTTALALFILFMLADNKKFYPAMPFLTAGCLTGLLITKLII